MKILKTDYNHIKEINELGDHTNAHEAMIEFYKILRKDYGRIYKTPISMFIISAVCKDRYGANFKRLIEINKLGSVLDSSRKVNPNSRNVIRVYIWNLDARAVSKWYKINK